MYLYNYVDEKVKFAELNKTEEAYFQTISELEKEYSNHPKHEYLVHHLAKCLDTYARIIAINNDASHEEKYNKYKTKFEAMKRAIDIDTKANKNVIARDRVFQLIQYAVIAGSHATWCTENPDILSNAANMLHHVEYMEFLIDPKTDILEANYQKAIPLQLSCVYTFLAIYYMKDTHQDLPKAYSAACQAIKYIGNREEIFVCDTNPRNDNNKEVLATKQRMIQRKEDVIKLFDKKTANGGSNNVNPSSPTANSQSKTPNGSAASNSKDNPNGLSAMERLQALIGLETVKRDVEELINFAKIQKKREENNLPKLALSNHLVFSGNPGTGKTTVARILAEIYKDIGILSKGHLVEVDRADLVAGFIGQTAIKTKEKLDEAMGGVLFIDEAYTLAKEGNDFGQEAIDTILKTMEDCRDNLIVIVAGYEDRIETFIESNPGLRSRFNKYIHFEDYNVDDLEKIFYQMINSYKYNVAPDAAVEVRKYLELAHKNKGEDFANGRMVRNFFEKIIAQQASRVANLGANISLEDMLLITKEDVQQIRKDEWDEEEEEPRKIGF